MQFKSAFTHTRCWLTLLLLFGSVNIAAAGYNDISKAPAGKYLLDKTHGYVTFSYLHQGYSRPWLRFRDIDATLIVDADSAEKSSVSVEIATTSIDSGVDIFDDHLRGDEFFNVEKFPTITFRSTAISFDGQAFALTGDLTAKGITKSVTFNGKFNQGGVHFVTKKPVLGFSATGKIKRSDFDLGRYAPMVGDEVDIVLEVEFNQQ